MYGYKDVYFNQKHENFRNSIWIELIGFDNTLPDYGVGDFLYKTGFVPDMVSFHLTAVLFAILHKGMEKEYVLPRYVCSYGGHDENDDRFRQQWTNYQLLGVIKEFHKHNVKIFVSMFDFLSPDEEVLDGVTPYADLHPEILVTEKDGSGCRWIVNMLKSFEDGTAFEDVLVKKLKEIIADYQLDGIQLADGISSPRCPLYIADWSIQHTDNFIKDMKLYCPKNLNTSPLRFDWILENYPKEWIEYNTRRWASFMDKIIKAITSTGAEAAFNSAWTKGPVEALYRYGTDYKSYVNSGAKSFIVEDVAADVFILPNMDGDNIMPEERRDFIYPEYASNLMQLRAYLPDTLLTPLCMIRDTHEQWDVLHHMPTAMQRAVSANLMNFLINKDGKFIPTTNGPHYCLGDGLKKHEWDDIRLMWDNAFIENVKDVKGVTVVWSDKKVEKEVDALINSRLWYNGKWVAELMHHGAAVHKIARIENLDKVSGDILVINPSLYEEDELEMINAYKGGNVLTIGLHSDGKIYFSEAPEIKADPISANVKPLDRDSIKFEYSLEFMDVPEEITISAAEYINESCGLPTITQECWNCNINEVILSKNKSRIYVDNNKYYYAVPTIKTDRKIKSVNVITKPSSYPIQRPDEHSFMTIIPGFSMDIAEIEYEN